MASEQRPGGASPPRFKTTLRGYDRGEVDRALRDLETEATHLREERDAANARLAALGERDLHAEIEAVQRDVAGVLDAARRAADAIRQRAANEATQWRAEGAGAADETRRKGHDDAVALRGDAWTAAEQLLTQVAAEAEAQRAALERELVTLRAEAERDAHQHLAAARGEAERLSREAQTSHDEMVEQTKRAEEQSQERIQAVEARRTELLGELEELRQTLESVEAEIEHQRERLDLVSLEVPGEVGGARVENVGFRLIPAPSSEMPSHPPAEESAVDALSMADEVRRLRQDQTRPADGGRPAEEAPLPSGGAELAPAPERSDEPVPPPAPSSDDLAHLFASLRGAGAAGETPGDMAGNDAATRVDGASPAPALTASPPDVTGAFELRERLLLPITNRVLRDVKRQLTEAQNLALEQLRLNEGAWQPDQLELEERLAPTWWCSPRRLSPPAMPPRPSSPGRTWAAPARGRVTCPIRPSRSPPTLRRV